MLDAISEHMARRTAGTQSGVLASFERRAGKFWGRNVEMEQE